MSKGPPPPPEEEKVEQEEGEKKEASWMSTGEGRAQRPRQLRRGERNGRSAARVERKPHPTRLRRLAEYLREPSLKLLALKALPLKLMARKLTARKLPAPKLPVLKLPVLELELELER